MHCIDKPTDYLSVRRLHFEMGPKTSAVCGILLLCIWTCAASVDPYSCCKIKKDGLVWDCKRCGLTGIPPNPPENITTAIFEANSIREIPKGIFRNYNKLLRLQLSNNSLTLQEGTAYFDDLPQLRYLSLARNHIVLSNLSKHNPDVFRQLISLTEFNMYRTEYNEDDDRYFEEYPGKFLAPLKSLMYVHLPVVAFGRFGDYFSDFSKLHVVSFLGSMPGAKVLWTEMKNETFINMPHLKGINILDSSLKTIDPYAFGMLKNLQRIQVFCSNLQAIELLNAIENLPKPSLETLVFEYDKSLSDVPRNKTFPSLSKLYEVVMGIPVLVPHPNPFMLDLLPIFWPSVRKLEIIRPYSAVYVDTVYKNPKDPDAPALQITVKNDLKDLPYSSACVMTSRKTKVDASGSAAEHHSRLSWDITKARLHNIQTKGSSADSMDMNPSVKKKRETLDPPMHKSFIQSGNRSPHKRISRSDHVHSEEPANVSRHLNPGCYSHLYSANICYRLLSLTLTFYISYTQSQVFDLVIREGQSLGIYTSLTNLIVNKLIYDSLPGDLILQDLVKFNISGADVEDLATRNMSNLKVYDFSDNLVRNLCKTDAVSRLHNLQVFNAANNNLKCIEEQSFKAAYNLTHVNLAKNDLKSISLNISHLKKLQMIDLSGNRIKYFPTTFIEQITNQSKVVVDLSDNSLACACGQSYITFISWLISHPNKFIDFKEYRCIDKNGDMRLIKDINIEEYKAECRSKLPVYIAVPVVCSIVVIILMTLSYKHRWRIMWYAYTVRTCYSQPRRRRRQTSSEDVQPIIDPNNEQDCDVFLGYAQDDVDIRSSMLDKLKEFRLSVIHPDVFEWGISVFLQSATGIKQCQKIVFLVTKNFAQCEICDFQLHMALIKGKENVILLQIDSEFELNNAGMQPFLRVLLLSDGTLEYGDNESFWNIFQRVLGV